MTKWIELASSGHATLLMSEVNLGEIFYLVAREEGITASENMLLTMKQTAIEIVPVAEGDVLRAARLKAKYTISYADCFCANLAIDHHAPVLTGDRDFLKLETAGLLTVHWLGA